MTDLNQFYHDLPEPNRACFLAIRKIALDYSYDLDERWKYKLPFFYYQNKPFCYIWKDKKTTFPYITFVRSLTINRLELELGDRKKMKALTVNPNKDINVELIQKIMSESFTFFK